MKKTRIIFFCVSLLAVCSCVETGPESPVMKGNSIFLPNGDGASVTITVDMAQPWQVENNSPWYGIAPLSGDAGVNTIRITAVDSNTSLKERVLPFRLAAGGETVEYFVIQAPADGMDIPEAGFPAGIDGGQLEFSLGCNLEYSVESRSDWIVVSSGAEYGDSVLLEDGMTKSRFVNSTFGLTVERNTGEVRSGEVVLLAGGKEFPVEIRQMGKMTADFSREFYKRSAIMRFTATWCGNCPPMAEAMAKAMEALPDRIVPLNLHASSSEGGLAYSGTAELGDYYGVQGYPTGVVNSTAIVMNNRQDITHQIFSDLVREAVESYPAKTAIGGYNVVSDGNIAITASIAAKESGSYRLCAFLLEDGIQYAQQSGGNDYVHDYVVRRESGELMGASVDIASGSVAEVDLEIPVPGQVSDIGNAYLVLYVTREGVPGTRTVEYAQYIECGSIIDNVVRMPLNGLLFFEYE